MAEKRKNVSTDVAERICSMILTEHRFQPRDKLPNERDFAEELGVSRTSIREAFKLLHANGTLEIRRGVGAFVSETPGVPTDPLGLAQMQDTKAMLLEWYEVRLALEPSAMEWVAQRATEEEILHMETLEQQISFCIRLQQDCVDLDMQLHNLLAQATHNEIFRRMLTSIAQSVNKNLMLCQDVELYAQLSSAIRRSPLKIVSFLRLGDGIGATLAMRHHLLRCIENLRSEIEKDADFLPRCNNGVL